MKISSLLHPLAILTVTVFVFLLPCRLLMAGPPEGNCKPHKYRDLTWRFDLGRYAPSYYGYNLDDTTAGYYGGGRYNEYYNFLRGAFWANYPDSVPGFPPDYRGPIHNKHYVPPPEPPTPAPHRMNLWPYRPNIWDKHHCHAFPVSQPTVATGKIVVHVPADAVIWVDDTQSQQTGTERRYESPPIPAGQEYHYHLKACWTENGQPIELTRDVIVRPGQRAIVDFTSAFRDKLLHAPQPLTLE
ncbi:MAG: TIGR03000 domain-containing protein [Gemmataceae bacterium]